MAKGYTKRNTPKHPRASKRGRIDKHKAFGRILMTITKTRPDGSTVEVQHHATKGIRIYHAGAAYLTPGQVG